MTLDKTCAVAHDRAMAGLARPSAFAWFSRHYITGGLALTMLAMGTSLKLAVSAVPVFGTSSSSEPRCFMTVSLPARLLRAQTATNGSTEAACLMRLWSAAYAGCACAWYQVSQLLLHMLSQGAH